MPELVAIQTDDYDFVIWSKDVSRSRNRLVKTLQARGKDAPSSCIKLSPALCIDGKYVSERDIGQPVFFENKQYDIEFVFSDSLKEAFTLTPPFIEHRLRAIEEAFHYSVRSHSLRATINTGNAIGWFRFELVYQVNLKTFRQAFSFEVLPIKMDMVSDLQVINAAIDDQFPLWRFSLAEKTQQQMKAVKKPHPQFLLLWLAQFESLVDNMLNGLKHIINAPHSRLMSADRSVKMPRIKGRLSQKLEQKVARAKADKQLEKRFTIEKKYLSVDTPENRFIKSVISASIAKLSKIHHAAENMPSNSDKQRLSTSFFNRLSQWQKTMQHFHRQPLFREVGSFSGLHRESLVLQQKPGYAKVYKAWQQLKWYLDLLEGDSYFSLRSVAELYEVWCFLEVRRILLELGFEEVMNKRIPMINDGINISREEGEKGAFNFTRVDGVTLRLAHEPSFGPKGATIKTWLTTQRPDIFLKATFPDGEKIVWLFDAKYRIKTPFDDDINDTEGSDYVPEDAINQMHRYRDALIHQERSENNQSLKTRPVFGAYALYPGFFDQATETNPYADAVDEVDIGAFSLLPANDHSGSIWLTRFLAEKLSLRSGGSADKYFVEEAPRIHYQGTKVTRFDDLVIAANQLGPSRDTAYIKNFESGDATFYHTKQLAFERQCIEHHIVKEAKYLAVALDVTSDKREIRFVYPILHAKQVRRADITRKQSGSGKLSDPDEWYWLFELGKSLKLKESVVLESDVHFQIKLVGLQALSSHNDWNALAERYSTIERKSQR
jgi:hypothetical protein